MAAAVLVSVSVASAVDFSVEDVDSSLPSWAASDDSVDWLVDSSSSSLVFSFEESAYSLS